MIFFITGPSSCGKTRLLQQLQHKFPQISFLSSDTFFKQAWQELKEEWKYKLDWSDAQEECSRRWLDFIHTASSNHQLVIIDDIATNVGGYLHDIRAPYKVFLIGVPLKRFFLNLRRRKDRRGGQVLQELMELYEPSPYPTGLTFLRSDLHRFKELKGYSGKGVATRIRKCENYFFQDKEKVYIRPSVTIPLPVHCFLNKADLEKEFSHKMKAFLDRQLPKHKDKKETNIKKKEGYITKQE